MTVGPPRGQYCGTRIIPKEKMQFFVYVLGSKRGKDRRTYVGWTIDLSGALSNTMPGVARSRLEDGKWVLLYSESCKTNRAAMSREWHIKARQSVS